MNRADMLSALTLAALAYKDIQPINLDEPLLAVDNITSGVQYFLRRTGDTLTISFRGSNEDEDWKTNLNFHKKTVPYGNHGSPIRVHRGFLEAYKSRGVRDRLHRVMTPDIRQVRITGHSYGAALAVLCAVDLEYNFADRDYEVFLFGCPRVGNGAFARSYNKRLFKTLRVENGNDIVTKVPFAFMGFRHVGARVPIGAPRLPLLFSFLAHYPTAYLKNLLSHGP